MFKNKIIIKFKGNKIKITNTPKFEITGDQEKFSINGNPVIVTPKPRFEPISHELLHPIEPLTNDIKKLKGDKK